MNYARGKYAFGYCDKTGFRYPLNDLIWEIRDGKRTGFRVGRDMVDPDHPQNHLGDIRINDPQSLRDPRPDQSMAESRGFFGWSPVGNTLVYLTASIGSVTVETS